MTHPELKPCPFCGADGEITYDQDHHGIWFNAGCSNSLCRAYNVYYTEDVEKVPEFIFWWNTRSGEEVESE